MSAERKKKIIIAGAGMSGLTAGAYLSRSGHEVSILERTGSCGGHVSSFSKEGFVFDAGPRAIGNAGILIPMLEDLDIDLPLVRGKVSTGIGNEIVHYDSNAGITAFIASLQNLFPEACGEIRKIHRLIKSNTRMAATLNRAANPFFKNVLKDREYLFKEFLPWIPSFLSVVLKTGLFSRPMEDVLASISGNQSLNDMVSQHFFKGTPSNFAFGYFENYQDYKYPIGGTGRLPELLARKFINNSGVIHTNTEAVKIDPARKKVTDQNGEIYPYDQLLWAADLRTLFRIAETEQLSSSLRRSVENGRRKYLNSRPGESVFSIFLAVDESPDYFKKISRGHFIYTPHTEGLGDIHRGRLDRLKAEFADIEKDEFYKWLEDFCFYNSYEISIPVLKDSSLAPENKTGLIISILFDGELFKLVEQAGLSMEFREKTIGFMIDTLNSTIYPGIKGKIIFKESSTPLTLMKMFKTSNGAITGWSLEVKPPVPSGLAGILSSVRTELPDIYKAGQWSYSPSGVPLAILTGRIAARAIGRKISGL